MSAVVPEVARTKVSTSGAYHFKYLYLHVVCNPTTLKGAEEQQGTTARKKPRVFLKTKPQKDVRKKNATHASNLRKPCLRT